MRNQVIGKHLARERIYEAVKLLKKYGIFTSGMFIMGFPEDTEKTMNDTYKMICDLQLDLNYVFNLIPVPGTKVFSQAMKDDLFLQKFDISDLWKGNISLDPNQDKKQFFIKPYQMTLEQLMTFRKRFDAVRIMSDQAKELNI
jgi:radical SAM superfamily enzyme YgiQ (UPF0313 family)